MADGIQITAGSGPTVATKDRGAVGHEQLVVSHPEILRHQETITLSGAYDTGDAVGGKISITNAARFAGGGGMIRDVVVAHPNLSVLNGNLAALFFSADPTGSTIVDNSPLVVAGADLPKVATACGRLWRVSGMLPVVCFAGGANWQQLQSPYVCEGTTLYMALVVDTGFTATGTVVVNVYYSPV